MPCLQDPIHPSLFKVITEDVGEEAAGAVRERFGMSDKSLLEEAR